MIPSVFESRFLSFLGLTASEEQLKLIQQLEAFVKTKYPYPVLIVNGFAGTGKTTILSTFVTTLSFFKVKTKLLAPTGRAAKVFALKANQDAFTIHKQIYRQKSSVDAAQGMSLQPNLFTNTVFIVDESSMIADVAIDNQGFASTRSLLEDLIEYVFSGKNCKLIFVGDQAQLPPVGANDSPALQESYLQDHFHKLNIKSFYLSHVLRQAYNSGILFNATAIRNLKEKEKPFFQIKKFKDVHHISGMQLQEYLEESYDRKGKDQAIVLTRSNKRANAFNNQIRSRILWFEDEICSGELLMVVKNNYFWLQDKSQMGFIANGEILKVVRMVKTEHVYGFDFARLQVVFVDYNQMPEMEILVLIETLQVEASSLNRERLKTLFFAVEQDYLHEKNKKKRYDLILKNPYFNALQVKYAYAITCHKSQGGQWEDVYIDLGHVPEEELDIGFKRWLYTAVTRAEKQLYLINFPKDWVDTDFND